MMKSQIAFIFAAFVAACSSSSSNSGSYLTAPAVNVSSEPTCNDAPSLASAVVIDNETSAQPAYTAAGGSIADGVYVLTSNTEYGLPAGSNPSGDQDTVIVNSGSWFLVDISPSGATAHGNRTAAASGTTLTFTSTCTGGTGEFLTGAYDFSASESGFMLYANKVQEGGSTAVIQFTRK